MPALLVMFSLYLFRAIIIGGHLLVGSDFVSFYLPMKKFFYDQIHQYGTIPLWNPYIFGGMPFWAHFESTIFYPLGFLFWLIQPAKAYGYTMFLHLIMAGVFMYILARSLEISRAGSFLAASIFTCNGFVMALIYLGHMGPVQSYIWLPIIIYFLNRAIHLERPYFYASVAGMLWGIQILGGAPQDAFYTFLASMFFLLLSARGYYDRFGRPGNYLMIPLCLFLFGAALAALQVVPAFELINESVREALDNYEMVTMASYPPEGLITTLMPHFFGNYVDDTYWVGGVPFSVPQQNLYVGILPLVLLLFLSFRTQNDRKVILFAGFLALIAVVLALGRHTPVYKLAYLLPGFDRFRAPSKIIVLWVFAMGLLAGKGMDGLLLVKERRSRMVDWRLLLCILSLIALVTIDIFLHFENMLSLKVFSLFVLDEAIPEKIMQASKIITGEFHLLTLFGGLSVLFVLLTRRRLLSPKLSALILSALLLANLSLTLGRAVVHSDATYLSIENIKQSLRRTLGQDNSIFRVGAYKSAFGPNLEMYLGFQTVGGFTALFPARYYEYVNAYAEGRLVKGWVSLRYGRSKNQKLMDLLNVKYEILHSEKICILRESYLPRAFMVPGFEVLEQGDILDRMVQKDFDPYRAVLFEKGDFNPAGAISSSQEPKPKSEVRILSYSPDEILIKVNSSFSGFLFLSEVYYPGWKCFVDDKEESILRGNYLFRVVQVPEGSHTVRFTFDPWTVKVGIGITLLTLFLFVLILAHGRLKLRKD